MGQIQPETTLGQIDLFDVTTTQANGKQLMKAVDRINRRFPKAISLATTGFDKTWKAKAERISKRYTTNWGELVMVN